MPHVTILKKDSYLKTIENSLGTHQYRSLMALVDGEKKDILEDGNLSCALYVSAILHQFGLIDSTIAPHARTESLVKNMEASGWVKTDSPTPGAVVVWEEMQQENHTVPHVGFWMSEEEAVSNSWKEKCPVRHHMTFGTSSDGSPMRNVTAVYIHPILEV
jgi:hypothetical protein